MSCNVADIPFGVMMGATLFSHETFAGHRVAANCNPISQLHSPSIAPVFEYCDVSTASGRTIAGNTPNDSLNAMQVLMIPLRAAIPMLAGGIDVPAYLARDKAATQAVRSEGSTLPC